MRHAAGTPHRLGQGAGVEKVALHKGEISMLCRGGEKFQHAGAQIVVTDDCFASTDQSVNQIATDKSRCTRDEGRQDMPFARLGQDRGGHRTAERL